MVGEIRTGFLAVPLTSFNFSTQAVISKTNLRIATCKMSLWGRKKAWELVPVVTYVLALLICLRMQYLMQGTSSLSWAVCFGDVIITAVEISLTDFVVHFLDDLDCLLSGQSKSEEAY